MAATRSLGSLVSRYFYTFAFLFLILGPFQNYPKYLLHRQIEIFSTKPRFFTRDAGWIFIAKLSGKFKLDLTVNGYFKSHLAASKWAKHGKVSFYVPGHDPPFDITVFLDVDSNPGPVFFTATNTTCCLRTFPDLHTSSSTPAIKYSRHQFFKILQTSKCPLTELNFHDLKDAGLFYFRGTKAARQSSTRNIKTIISTRAGSTGHALLHSSIDRNNLISIQLQPLHKSVHHRKLLPNFALVNSRTIMNKTLMLKDYIIEHDLDILAITETWLHDDDFDVFFCHDICPAGFRFYHDPRTTSEGGGVALLVRNQFKVCKQQLADYKSFEAFEAVLKSSGNHNLSLVIIYRPPLSTSNGLSVKLFLEEFSAYLEHSALAPGHLLLAGDFNFHIDQPDDSDARCFLRVLESFDLMQHVTGPTHYDGHSLDLVITRANVNGMVSNWLVGHRISGHFAVRCNLHYAKPPPERKMISFRKTRSIDFTRFREELASSSLFAGPSCELGELVE